MKKYNAQRQGNEDHLHNQDEKDKPALKQAAAKAKQKNQDPQKKGSALSAKGSGK